VVGEYKTRIEIETGDYLKGDVPFPSNKEKDIQTWLDKWRDDMIKGWNDCRDGIEPSKIPPLY
jgi:hypothetical protein